MLQLLSDRDIVPEMELRWPTVSEMEESSRLFVDNRENGALLKSIFAAFDGGWFWCGEYVDANLQNAYYGGYTQVEEATNILVKKLQGGATSCGTKFLRVMASQQAGVGIRTSIFRTER